MTAAPEIRKAQIWGHQTDPYRQFFVLTVTGRKVFGWDYHTNRSATRDKTLDPFDLIEDYVLVEDTPASWLQGASRD